MSPDLELYFVVQDISYSVTLQGIKVTITTNNPIFLYFRWSTYPPQKHINRRNVRGAPLGTWIDQCFVVYDDIPQEEAGSTLTHTFIVEPWPYCQTRWFYFWGRVGPTISPSRSPIFKYHNSAIMPLCSNAPHPTETTWSAVPCYHRSYAFTPCTTFSPTSITLWLYEHPSHPPADWVQIFMWTSKPDGEPLVQIGQSPAISTSHITPTPQPVSFPLVCSDLIYSLNYAFSYWWSYYPRLFPTKWAGVMRGQSESCPHPAAEYWRTFFKVCTTPWNSPCDCSGVPWTSNPRPPPAYAIYGTTP